MRVVAVIEGCEVIELNDKSVPFSAYGRIDDDGTGPGHGDYYHQGDTTFPRPLRLHRGGTALNADKDRYIVVPPQIVRGVKGVVMGAQASVTFNGLTLDAVVGDVGPRNRLGEMSRALALALGIDANPNTGGINSPSVHYIIYPGVAAVVEGIHYQLQAA